MSDQPTILYCYNHPSIETSLRCNNCGRPICPKCAMLTPTGYRCKECVRGQQKVFDTAEGRDYPVGLILAGGLTFLGSFAPLILSGFRLGWLIVFVAAPIGVGIAEVIRKAIGRRRSTRLFSLIAVACVLGCLPLILFELANAFLLGGVYGWLDLLWQGIYAFFVTSTVYYRLRGINIR